MIFSVVKRQKRLRIMTEETWNFGRTDSTVNRLTEDEAAESLTADAVTLRARSLRRLVGYGATKGAICVVSRTKTDCRTAAPEFCPQDTQSNGKRSSRISKRKPSGQSKERDVFLSMPCPYAGRPKDELLMENANRLYDLIKDVLLRWQCVIFLALRIFACNRARE